MVTSTIELPFKDLLDVVTQHSIVEAMTMIHHHHHVSERSKGISTQLIAKEHLMEHLMEHRRSTGAPVIDQRWSMMIERFTQRPTQIAITWSTPSKCLVWEAAWLAMLNPTGGCTTTVVIQSSIGFLVINQCIQQQNRNTHTFRTSATNIPTEQYP